MKDEDSLNKLFTAVAVIAAVIMVYICITQL